MKKVIQFAFATLTWGFLLLFYPLPIIRVLGVAILPIVCAVFAILGTVAPGFFSMGVAGFKTANIVEKLAPIVVIGLLFYGLSFIPQTYATAILISVLLGNTTSYVGYLVGGFFK